MIFTQTRPIPRNSRAREKHTECTFSLSYDPGRLLAICVFSMRTISMWVVTSYVRLVVMYNVYLRTCLGERPALQRGKSDCAGAGSPCIYITPEGE